MGTELILALLVLCMLGAAGLVWVRRSRQRSAHVPSREAPSLSALGQSLVPTQSEPALPSLGPSDPVGLVLEGSSGSLLTLEPSTYSGDGAPVPNAVLANLSSFLQEVPALISEGQQILSDSYRVVLKPEFLEGIKDGSFTMMKSREVAEGFRLNVVDKTGTIVGQGTNVPVGKALQIASAGFQIATFVTAQAHLAQINARLEEIQTTLADVLAQLQEGQEGQLRGKMDYLRGLAVDLQARPLELSEVTVYHNQLETVERETLELARALELELKRRAEDIDEVDLANWFNRSKSEAATLREALSEYERTAKRYELTLWVRLAALQLKAYLPHPPATLETRRAEVLDSIKAFETINLHVQDRTRERAREVRGAFTRERTLDEIRRALSDEVYERTGPLQISVEQMRGQADSPRLVQERRAQVAREGLTLDVHRTDNGKWAATTPRD